MAKTATEQAIAIIERGLTVAKRDNAAFQSRNVKISPKGYFFISGQRCGQNDAIQALAHVLNEEAKAETEALAKAKPGQRARAAGPMSYESLNQATRDFFFDLAELIQQATKDAANRVPARLGAEIPKITPQNQPRLTNLKKAGVVMSGNVDGRPKSHKFVWLTEQGQAIWAAHA
jgi:hypothetical protein